jgi:hypothetical protein
MRRCFGSGSRSLMGKATNIGGRGHGLGEPTDPVLDGMGGGGGGGRWRQDSWVWPLPPSGPVGFVCEWPAAGIPLGRHEIDAQVLLDAAGEPSRSSPMSPLLIAVARGRRSASPRRGLAMTIPASKPAANLLLHRRRRHEAESSLARRRQSDRRVGLSQRIGQRTV